MNNERLVKTMQGSQVPMGPRLCWHIREIFYGLVPDWHEIR